MSDGSWKLEISWAWCCLQRNISTGRRGCLLYNWFKPLLDSSLCLRVFWKACCLCFLPSLPPFLSLSLPLSLFVCVVRRVWACLSSILIIFVCFRRMKSRLSGTSWSFWIVDFLSLTSWKIVSDLYRTSYILVIFFPKCVVFILVEVMTHHGVILEPWSWYVIELTYIIYFPKCVITPTSYWVKIIQPNQFYLPQNLLTIAKTIQIKIFSRF